MEMRRCCLESLRIRSLRNIIAHRFASPTSPMTRVDNRSTAFLLSVQGANNTSMACEKHEHVCRDLRMWLDCSNTSIRPRLNTPPTACQMQTPPFEKIFCPLFDPKPRKDLGFYVGSLKKEASGMEHGTQFSLATFNSTHPPNRSTGSNSIEAHP